VSADSIGEASLPHRAAPRLWSTAPIAPRRIMLSRLIGRFVTSLKQILYGKRGEPYRLNGHTLRFAPGSRPIRMRHKNSRNSVNRNDALQVELFATQLKPGDIAFDVGAHAGQYCILMAALCGPAGVVVAFEPDPHARELLSRNLEINPGIRPPRVEPFALSDRVGTATLYSRGGNTQSSLAAAGVGHQPDRPAEQLEVRTVTLDDYIERTGIGAPTWVKIDAEGAEISILKGASELLRSDARIVCELHPYAWEEFGTSLEELESLVQAAGRRMSYLGTENPVVAPVEYGAVLIEREPL
jgi:FkbM family methyltransferase